MASKNHSLKPKQGPNSKQKPPVASNSGGKSSTHSNLSTHASGSSSIVSPTASTVKNAVISPSQLKDYVPPLSQEFDMDLHLLQIKQEIEFLDAELLKMKKTRFEIAKDGACLFRSTSHGVFGTQVFHSEVRSKCVEHMLANKDTYVYFIDLDCDASNESEVGAEYVKYVEKLRGETAWGGHLEIQALSHCYETNFIIYQALPVINPPSNTNDSSDQEEEQTTISYKIVETKFENNYDKCIELAYSHGNHYDVVLDIATLHDMAFFQQLTFLMIDTLFEKDNEVRKSIWMREDIPSIDTCLAMDTPVAELMGKYYDNRLLKLWKNKNHRNMIQDEALVNKIVEDESSTSSNPEEWRPAGQHSKAHNKGQKKGNSFAPLSYADAIAVTSPSNKSPPSSIDADVTALRLQQEYDAENTRKKLCESDEMVARKLQQEEQDAELAQRLQHEEDHDKKASSKQHPTSAINNSNPNIQAIPGSVKAASKKIAPKEHPIPGLAKKKQEAEKHQAEKQQANSKTDTLQLELSEKQAISTMSEENLLKSPALSEDQLSQMEQEGWHQVGTKVHKKHAGSSKPHVSTTSSYSTAATPIPNPVFYTPLKPATTTSVEASTRPTEEIASSTLPVTQTLSNETLEQEISPAPKNEQLQQSQQQRQTNQQNVKHEGTSKPLEQPSNPSRVDHTQPLNLIQSPNANQHHSTQTKHAEDAASATSQISARDHNSPSRSNGFQHHHNGSRSRGTRGGKEPVYVPKQNQTNLGKATTSKSFKNDGKSSKNQSQISQTTSQSPILDSVATSELNGKLQVSRESKPNSDHCNSDINNITASTSSPPNKQDISQNSETRFSSDKQQIQHQPKHQEQRNSNPRGRGARGGQAFKNPNRRNNSQHDKTADSPEPVQTHSDEQPPERPPSLSFPSSDSLTQASHTVKDYEPSNAVSNSNHQQQQQQQQHYQSMNQQHAQFSPTFYQPYLPHPNYYQQHPSQYTKNYDNQYHSQQYHNNHSIPPYYPQQAPAFSLYRANDDSMPSTAQIMTMGFPGYQMNPMSAAWNAQPPNNY